MRDIYNNYEYLSTNPTWHAEHSYSKAADIHRLLVDNKISFATLAEVGCGAGGILANISDMFAGDKRYYGFEPSVQAFELCMKHDKDNVEYHCCNLSEFAHESFDVLLCIDVIEHVEDYFSFLRMIRDRAMHHVFRIPLEITVQGILRDSLMLGRRGAGHLHYFTKETAIASLKDAGYEIIDARYSNPIVKLSEEKLIRKLVILLRRMLFRINRDFAVRLLGGWSLLVLARPASRRD